MGKCCRCAKNVNVQMQDNNDVFKEQLKNYDIKYKKIEFRIDVDIETIQIINQAHIDSMKQILRKPLFREINLKNQKELDLRTSQSRSLIQDKPKYSIDKESQLCNLITANWPYFILLDDNTLEAFNDLDCIMISLWQFEVSQDQKNTYRDLYVPMAQARIDLEKMLAYKDDEPTLEK